MNKKIIIVLAVVALVGAGIFYFVSRPKAPAQNKTETAETEKITKTQVATNKIPDGFPSDIPMEAGASIVQNYNAASGEGDKQATRSFISKKSLAENLTIYTDYMKSKGWTIGATINKPTNKMVAGTKGQQQLQVTMSENATTKEKTVTIYLTDLSK